MRKLRPREAMGLAQRHIRMGLDLKTQICLTPQSTLLLIVLPLHLHTSSESSLKGIFVHFLHVPFSRSKDSFPTKCNDL